MRQSKTVRDVINEFALTEYSKEYFQLYKEALEYDLKQQYVQSYLYGQELREEGLAESGAVSDPDFFCNDSSFVESYLEESAYYVEDYTSDDGKTYEGWAIWPRIRDFIKKAWDTVINFFKKLFGMIEKEKEEAKEETEEVVESIVEPPKVNLEKAPAPVNTEYKPGHAAAQAEKNEDRRARQAINNASYVEPDLNAIEKGRFYWTDEILRKEVFKDDADKIKKWALYPIDTKSHGNSILSYESRGVKKVRDKQLRIAFIKICTILSNETVTIDSGADVKFRASAGETNFKTVRHDAKELLDIYEEFYSITNRARDENNKTPMDRAAKHLNDYINSTSKKVTIPTGGKEIEKIISDIENKMKSSKSALDTDYAKNSKLGRAHTIANDKKYYRVADKINNSPGGMAEFSQWSAHLRKVSSEVMAEYSAFSKDFREARAVQHYAHQALMRNTKG